MPRVKVGPAPPDASTLDVEIARLRDLWIASLQARSRNVFRRKPVRIIHIDPLRPVESHPPVPYSRAWQDMSLSESPSAWGAVSRSAPRMPLLNPISTERSLYLS
jgi:hypothetical protein